MLEKPSVMAMAGAMSSHAAFRQGLIAENIANADTPGYRSKDAAAFSEAFGSDPGPDLRVTRAGHVRGGSGGEGRDIVEIVPGHLSPNGNGVSLEAEMVRAAEVRRDHDTALAVYRTSLDILRASLGRR